MANFGTILGQGTFTSDGNLRRIAIPSNADWMFVKNYTAWGAAGAAGAIGLDFYWQRGMASGTGIVQYKSNGTAVMNGDTLVGGGFTLLNTAENNPLAAVATTASTNAAQPVVSTANTAGLITGSVVRLSDIAAVPNILGFDFEIDTVVANTSFRMRYALAGAPGAVGGAGSYRVVPFDPIYYPRNRYIVNITQAASAVIRLSVTHNFTVGQDVRIIVPEEFGMTEMNNRLGTITAVSTANNTITVNIDSTAFTAFNWPTIASWPFNWAQVVPVGEDSATSLSSILAQAPLDVNGALVNGANTGLLADATVNTAFLGMTLGTGGNGTQSGAAIVGPAGRNADVMYWIIGKSEFGGL